MFNPLYRIQSILGKWVGLAADLGYLLRLMVVVLALCG